jgi:hypothetical protein
MKPVRWLFAVAVVSVALSLLPRPADAHQFAAPEVTIRMSDRTAGGHPDLQTTITLDEGATFDEVRVVAPPGGTIAADLDIQDGSIVGRLEGTATTNAIVRAECDFTSDFAVSIREATTDTTSPDYPAYLNELAPGRHRLRLVADVSPSPDVPILINYLFDLDATTGTVVSHTFVGNPLAPPAQFRTCTPSTSVVTLFGRTPNAIILLTNADPMPAQPSPYRYTFTSRPDADGHRHEEHVEAVAQLGAVDRGSPPAAPRNLRLFLLGATGKLEWQHDGPVESFSVQVLTTDLTGEGHGLLEPFTVSGSERSFFIDTPQIPSGCDESVVYRVAAVYAGGTSAFVETEPVRTCVEGPENPSPQPVIPPDAGDGSRRSSSKTLLDAALLMTLAGGFSLVCGVALRRRRLS